MSRAPKSQLKQGKPYTSTPLHICMYSIVTIKHFWTRGLWHHFCNRKFVWVSEWCLQSNRKFLLNASLHQDYLHSKSRMLDCWHSPLESMLPVLVCSCRWTLPANMSILYFHWYLKGSFDEVCLELKTVKSELGKVWDMLEIKVTKTQF